MNDPRPPLFRRHFTAFLIAGLLFGSAVTLGVFTYFARAGLAERRATNRANLQGLGEAMRQYVTVWQRMPDDPAALYPAHVATPKLYINPVWPEQPGYVYVTGVAPQNDAGDTLILYENVPERKQKLGRQALTLDQTVLELTEADLQQRLAKQEALWTKSGRRWRLLPVNPPIAAPAP